MDLVPTYLARLRASGVHMTAYIANLLIKGYASVGELERARDIFESLQDPQEGVAAPHNHAPHQNKQPSTIPVPADAPVFREVRYLPTLALHVKYKLTSYSPALNLGGNGPR